MSVDVSVFASMPWRQDDPDRLTSTEVARLIGALSVTRWTEHGYRRGEVDEILRRVVRTLEMAATEIASLYQYNRKLQGHWIKGEDPADLLVPDFADEVARERIVNLYAEAQLAADRQVGAAQDLAARVTADARAHREALLADAERVRRDADAYAERVRAEAEGQARKAASAALERPVGPDAERLVRAERARSASLGARSDVYVKHIRILLAAGMEICDQAQQEPGGA